MVYNFQHYLETFLWKKENLKYLVLELSKTTQVINIKIGKTYIKGMNVILEWTEFFIIKTKV